MEIKDYSSMLIVMDQGIGNMIDLTPALRVLKQLKPDLQITVLGRQPALQIVEKTEFVDKVLTEPDGSKYDIGILAIWWNYTVGQYTQQVVDSCKEVFQLDYRTIDKPEWWVYLEIPRLFGWTGDLAEPFCYIKEPAAIYIDPERVNIAIADTAAKASQNKRWPYFPDLVNALIANDHNVILVGSDAEAREIQVDKMPASVINCLGRLSVPETGYLLSQCDYVVGNDCGIAQMGAIFNVPTIMIFGPTYVPKNYPLGKNVKVVRHTIDCAPCQYTDKWQNCQDWQCMKQVTLEDVLRALQEI